MWYYIWDCLEQIRNQRLEREMEKRCRKPPRILLSYTNGGTTITGEIMDITLHVGGREFFQLSGKDAAGDSEPLTNDTISEVTSDPQIATVTPNPADATMIAIDGIAVGKCTITINLTNADGVAAQPTVLNITVLAQDIVEVNATQIGGEGKVGDPFPGTATPTTK